MTAVRPIRLEESSCLREYGRADLALQTSIETPFGSVDCAVLDVSLGGRGVAADLAVETGEALVAVPLQIEGLWNCRVTQDNVIGVQFEEKLPKAFVLSLRGEIVDPLELERVEAMLAARDWVVGTPVERPRSQRLASVPGSRSKGYLASVRSGVFEALPSLGGDASVIRRGNHRQAILLIILSAVLGALIGIVSALTF